MEFTHDEQLAYIKSCVREHVKKISDAKRIIKESSDYHAIELAKEKLAIYVQVGAEFQGKIAAYFSELDQAQAAYIDEGLPRYAAMIGEVADSFQQLLDASCE